MKKVFVTGLAFVLAIVASITGTLAWLTAKTEAVTNTFTVGDIDITLIEHQYDPNDTEAAETNSDGEKIEQNEQNYKLIPGTVYFKDPTVTVKANSEKCYLFVEFTETNNPSTYLTYTSNLSKTDTGWTQGTGTTGTDVNGVPTNVWFRTVEASTTDTTYELLDDNKVTVKTNIIKKPVNATNKADKYSNPYMPATDAQPSLNYKAYAIQSDNITDVATAWEKVSEASKPTT